MIGLGSNLGLYSLIMKLTNIFRTETLQLNTHHDDFWLYDETLKMNLAMKAKTEREAFVKALEYYQRELAETQEKLNVLTSKVSSFVQFLHDDCDITPEIQDPDQWD